MSYELKNKIVVSEEFLNELITKSWQDTEAIQQQIASIDTSTVLGSEVVRLLKNTCTNYYVLIGCLEALKENNNVIDQETVAQATNQEPSKSVYCGSSSSVEAEYEKDQITQLGNTGDFEPFEYFVDFEEPSGEPLSDKDLYN